MKTDIDGNTGNATLNISSLATTGDFASNNCGAAVNAGATCTLSITFTPTTTGPRTGATTITDNAANSPHVISMYRKIKENLWAFSGTA